MHEDVRTHPEDGLLEPLGEVWCRVFRVPGADPDTTPADLANQSLAVIELMVEVQQRWGVTLPLEAMLTGLTLRTVARLIAEGDSEPHR